jgi:hypothetical protein
MTDVRLTPSQQLLMWNLFARGGSAFQKDIKPEIDAKDRKTLEKLRYVMCEKKGRGAIFITLEEPGWDALDRQEPQLFMEGDRAITADRRLLQAVLTGLRHFARVNETTLYEIFKGERLRATELDKSEPEEQPREPIDHQIRDAFFAIAGHPPQMNVRLSALRAKLAHIKRADLDAALLSMREAGHANLMNLDNPRDIETEKDAALTSGLHTFHVLWIDE